MVIDDLAGGATLPNGFDLFAISDRSVFGD